MDCHKLKVAIDDYIDGNESNDQKLLIVSALNEFLSVYLWRGCSVCMHVKTDVCDSCLVNGDKTAFDPKWNHLGFRY